MNKIVIIIGSIIGIFAALLWVFEPSLGWWEVTVEDYLVIFDGAGYISPFGYGSNTANSDIVFHGPLLLIGGIILAKKVNNLTWFFLRFPIKFNILVFPFCII